ncbi:MAG: hypothetical protein ABI239_05255 [Aquihabitans sp.]
MELSIVAAVFIENIELRAAPGPSTRIDLTGVHFSMAAPGPVPVTVEPHLVVLVHCPHGAEGTGALESLYLRDGEQVARNVQPLTVEPGKFAYRLVKSELTFDDYGSIEVQVRVDHGPVTTVPYTLLPPADG